MNQAESIKFLTDPGRWPYRDLCPVRRDAVRGPDGLPPRVREELPVADGGEQDCTPVHRWPSVYHSI